MAAIRKILVPTDLSAQSERALTLAMDMAKMSAAEIELVYVYPSPSMLMPEPLGVVSFTPGDSKVVARIDKALQSRAKDVAAKGIRCSAVTLTGSPAVEIVRRAAEGGVDLLVMGTHGRGGIAHAVLGSVAERVVQKSTLPVLVVPPQKR